MSVVADIIARLLESPTEFRIVEGVADFSAIETRKPPTPAAFVLVPEEAASENTRATGPILQRIETDIDVIIVDENLTSARMGEAAGDLETLKAFVRSRLIGFEPTSSAEPMEFVSGKLLKARSGTVWHADTYALSTYFEEQP